MSGLSGQRSALPGFCLLALAGTAAADPKPLWDFGLGVGSVVFMDYRGADTTHVYVLPIAYFYYRGKFLQADRNGVRGRLFNQDRVELNISLNATAPVRRNAARAGMADLRPTIEIGPSLDVHLWRSADRKLRFDVRLPVRESFTVQAVPRAIGWQFTPHAALDIDDVAGLPGWSLGLLTGPLFADRQYNNYFYTVAPQFASAQRPAYQAHGGYAGTQVLAALTKRYPSFWVGAYVRHDSLAGASFEASPLVKRTDYWSGGLGIAWMIRQSSRLVEADD
ncbi:MAG TPA: MipA/OmpV family protein [Steroidobacteraceae bacterium]|nr:MipA/OmpV family protein [Steroidobacteraceae bacterium]